MKLDLDPKQSAPECQLSKQGTQSSYDILLAGAQNLSDKDLWALEDDLAFYNETGLIGVHMSELLIQLQTKVTKIAA